MSLYDKCYEFLEELPLKDGDTILVAVSGGRDSVVLLSALYEIMKQREKGELTQIAQFSLAVAHFNHKSRGVESDYDEAFVKNFAENLGRMKDEAVGQATTVMSFEEEGQEENQETPNLMEFFLSRAPVEELAKEMKVGFEEAGRILRYQFFQKIAKEQGFRYIATAHHAADNLETLLLHLARGCGAQGLTGIAPVRGNIIRPMLSATQEEIEAYVTEKQLLHREDLSNQDESFRRNKVRHQILTTMEEINPQYLEHSNNTIGIIREENDFLNGLVEEQLPVGLENGCKTIRISRLFEMPSALRGRALQFVTELQVPGVKLSRIHREQILKLAQSETPSGEIRVSADLRVRRSYGKLLWESHSRKVEISPDPVVLLPDVPCRWGDYNIIVHEVLHFTEDMDKNIENHLWLRAMTPLLVRSRQEGDILKPKNRPTKTLKKWCIDEKIPRNEREFLPVFVSGDGEVVGVAQLGADTRFLAGFQAPAWHIILDKGEMNHGTV